MQSRYYTCNAVVQGVLAIYQQIVKELLACTFGSLLMLACTVITSNAIGLLNTAVFGKTGKTVASMTDPPPPCQVFSFPLKTKA